jgi:hypothetical protein
MDSMDTKGTPIDNRFIQIYIQIYLVFCYATMSQSIFARNTPPVSLKKSARNYTTPSPSQRKRSDYAPRYTAEDVKANYGRLLPISANVIDFPTIFPELTDKNPTEVIHALAKRFKEKPTVENSTLLQAAINKFGSVKGGGSHSVKHAIKEAQKLFHLPSQDKKDSGQDDIWFNAFVDENYGGGSLFMDMPQAFSAMGYSWVGSDFNDKLTSLQGGCSTSEVGGHVMLFQDVNFGNAYQNFALTGAPPGNTIADPNVGQSFNDQTSSILMLRRYPNETRPVSFASWVPPSSVANIVEGLGPNVQFVYSPIYSWDLWPNGSQSHPNDPFKTFVYIRVGPSALPSTKLMKVGATELESVCIFIGQL